MLPIAGFDSSAETLIRYIPALRTVADPIVVGALVVISIIFPFLVIPELLERAGYNPKSGRARAVVWLSFFALVLIPAAVTGFLFSVSSVGDWVLLVVFALVAVLYDYYRLNPERIPWRRRSP